MCLQVGCAAPSRPSPPPMFPLSPLPAHRLPPSPSPSPSPALRHLTTPSFCPPRASTLTPSHDSPLPQSSLPAPPPSTLHHGEKYQAKHIAKCSNQMIQIVVFPNTYFSTYKDDHSFLPTHKIMPGDPDLLFFDVRAEMGRGLLPPMEMAQW